MLNHEQISRLRSQIVDTSQFPESFDGYHLAHAIYPFVPPQATPGPSEAVGRLYRPEQVFGEPFAPECLHGIVDTTVTAPPTRLWQIPKARIAGNSVVLSADTAFAPMNLAGLDPDTFAQVERDYTGCVILGREPRLSISFAARTTPKHFSGRAFFLPNLEPENYGSFIFRQLPQLLLAAANRFEFDFYVMPDRTPWLLDALDLLNFPKKPTFCTREVSGDTFDAVLFMEYFDNEGFAPIGVRKLMEQLITHIAGSPPQSGIRHGLYVSRTLSTIHRPWYRVLRNELEIEALFERHGFEVIYPETMRLSEQIRAFATATHVAGLSGSGMLNTVFCRSQAKILDIETVTNTVRQHAKVYASTGLRYAYHFAKEIITADRDPIFRDYIIHPEELRPALEWLGA